MYNSFQVQAKSANRLFTGDADMSWFDKLKDSFRFQGKLRYPHQVRLIPKLGQGHNISRLPLSSKEGEYGICHLPNNFSLLSMNYH